MSTRGSMATRCVRCGMPVAIEPTGATTPGVAICPYCQAEVPFGRTRSGDLGGRVAFADRTHPVETGVTPASAAKWARCFNCGTRVPLLGATPTERTGSPPGDIADTVTCPECGVEVPAVDEGQSQSLDVLDAIYERRSVRSYTDDSVDRASIERLLDVAVQAPSAVNMQPWAFAVVQDHAQLRHLAARTAQLYLTVPAAREVTDLPSSVLSHFRQVFSRPGYDVFHHAGTLIVIYATSPEGVPDCFLAGENLMLVACAMGYGTCPIGLARPCLDLAEVKHELSVPQEYVAALPIVVGIPAGTTPRIGRRRPRVLSWR